MAQIPKQFNAKESESKWYKYWQESGYFRSEPDNRQPYIIVMPPPNVTGVLHMGHMLNNTIQDVLIRRARMQGKNACWVPGTDHASIATEAKVVQKLKNEGIDKSALSREEFLKHAWEWTDKHGGIILDQLKRLGASCDWDRTAFTMDETRYESVIQAFIKLHDEGLIYRGYRMVNWDCDALTTVSDEEVIHKDVQAQLYYVKYQVKGENEFVTIATTRPETIMGDSAVCINPNDERFSHLKGKTVIVPVCNREVPIIEDDYVDTEFGTGCLKITPAHDVNDKEIGERHNLEVIDIFNDNGTLNSYGLQFEGKDRFVVQKEVAALLKENGSLVKTEDYKTTVGTSERTGSVIEPKISLQWFLKMKDLASPALESVMSDDVRLIPAKFKNTYRHWMENVRDWCVSRQLYWGHQIPVWYYGSDQKEYVVAENAEDALKKAVDKSGNSRLKVEDLTRDRDVLDTWFSSWLWPISVFDGIRNPDNDEINYYYPGNDLVTAPEILFFWVARMVMSGYFYRDKKPFNTVYLTGIVRDKKGRKMSKSLGNSPDPVQLMEEYTTDGVRMGMLLTSPAGNDLPFDETLCAQGRNFSNKIWNALRLIKGWEIDKSAKPSKAAIQADEWFTNRFAATMQSIEANFDVYRVSDCLMSIYKLTWDDFCSKYLELIKPAYGDPCDAETVEKAVAHFENLLKLLHPFMPFITEELWHSTRDEKREKPLIITEWPNVEVNVNESLLNNFESAFEVISEVRNFRKKHNIPNKESVQLMVKAHAGTFTLPSDTVCKLAHVDEVISVNEKPESAYGFVVNRAEFFIPVEGVIDAAAEAEKLKEELEYTKGFLKKVAKKLENKRFTDNAPDKVVQLEVKKKEDAEAKIRALEEQISNI